MNTRDDLPTEEAPGIPTSPSVRLIRHAASRMPPGLAERLTEEWIADLSQQRGALNRARFVLGCLWAKQVIDRDPQLYGARLSAAGHGNVDVVHLQHPSFLPRRATVFLVIVLLHVAAALAFIYAFKVRALPIPSPPMTVIMFSDPKPATPPPPRPHVPPTPVSIPAVPLLRAVPNVPVEPVQAVVRPVTTVPTVVPVPVRVPGGIGNGFPNTNDYYPPSAIRLGESGVTAVSVCADEHGRLTTDPKVAMSSGSPRLDGGALALARAGTGHYRSTTEDGRAVSACFQIGVRFALSNQ